MSCAAAQSRTAVATVDYAARNREFLEQLRTPPDLPFDRQPVTKDDAYRIIEWAGRCADAFRWRIADAKHEKDLEMAEAFDRMRATYIRTVLRIAQGYDLDCDMAADVTLDAQLYEGYFLDMPEPSEMAESLAQACVKVLPKYLAFAEKLPADGCTPTRSLQPRIVSP